MSPRAALAVTPWSFVLAFVEASTPNCVSERLSPPCASAGGPRFTAQKIMATSSDAEAAALERVDAADTAHDVAAITREFAALPSSELVVARCCEALKKKERAEAAADSANELVPLLLEALRRHANCTPVVLSAWRALETLLLNSAAVEPAVAHGALELVHGTLKDVLVTVLDTPAERVKSLLAIVCRLSCPNHAPLAAQLGGVEVRFLVFNAAVSREPTKAVALAMRRFPADAEIQLLACVFFGFLTSPLDALTVAPDVVQRVTDAGTGELVVAALRAHVDNASVSNASCYALCIMQRCGAAPSIDAVETASLAAAALRAHPFDDAVQKDASTLSNLLLGSNAAPPSVGASPERAALARVAELKGRRDFASLVRDMDAFPECEELQCAGSDAIDDIIREGAWPEEAAAAGAIECVVRTLDLFPFSADTQRTSMRTLGELTFFEVNLHRVGSAGAVRLAVHALRSFPNDTNLMFNALVVLGNVTAKAQFCAEALKLGALALGVTTLRR